MDLASIREGSGPTILLVHGFGVTKEEGGMFDGLAAALVSAGFSTVRYDFAGCGESPGDFSETSLTAQAEQLRSIVSLEQPVGIISMSFGTSVTIALNPSVKFHVFLGIVTHPHESLSALFREGYNPDGLSRHKRSHGGYTEVESGFWQDLDSYDLPALCSKITAPALFLHGASDDKIPVSNMEDAFAHYNGPKEKHVIPGGHGFLPHRDDMYARVAEWVGKFI